MGAFDEPGPERPNEGQKAGLRLDPLVEGDQPLQLGDDFPDFRRFGPWKLPDQALERAWSEPSLSEQPRIEVWDGRDDPLEPEIHPFSLKIALFWVVLGYFGDIADARGKLKEPSGLHCPGSDL